MTFPARAFFVACVCALSSVPGHAQSAASPTEYLDVARQVARHLASVERAEAVGVSWPTSNVTTARQTGIDAGAAGIGWFHLELYKATGDSSYLVTAERAAAFVNHRYRSGQMNGPDWLGGAAGGGAFMLALHDETRKAAYLEDAVFAADWLVRTAIHDGDGRYWRHGPSVPNTYTGLYHGAAGIGLFLLDVYDETGGDAHLETAKAAARWLEGHRVEFGPEAIGWKRLTTDGHAYHHLCGGSTGIMPFLERLWDVTGDEHYLTLFRHTANGLILSAQPSDAGLSWTYTSSQTGSTPVIFCHGASSAAAALLYAYQVTSDSTYLTAARSAGAWTLSVARSVAEDESSWPHILHWEQFESGYRTGTASVGHALLRLHRDERQPEYLSGARAAASYLMHIADRPDAGGIRWLNYAGGPRPDWVQDYRTGWYSGAAGIGMFFLELDATLRDRRSATLEVW